MPARDASDLVKRKRELERSELLVNLQGWIDLPMVILSFVMLVLFIAELTMQLSPDARRTISLIQWIIWVMFVVEYAIEMALADDKIRFVKQNWLITLAIILPVFRVFRVVRAVRSFGVLRVITISNRAINDLRYFFDRRRLHYVAAVMVAVTLLSGAGMYYVERTLPGANIRSFGDGLWWSAGTLTTVGTELYPVSAEGRVLAVLVMVFGVTVFGYVAGSLASFFVNTDQSSSSEERDLRGPAGDDKVEDVLRELQQIEARIEVINEAKSGHSAVRASNSNDPVS
ncbi:MAG: potassium channel family protein [Armatimonadota bacterium]|nr:potassium channel family protein [bacterium]